MSPPNGNGNGRHVNRATVWALGAALSVITLLVTLGANAQLRRIDTIEARLLAVEQKAAAAVASIEMRLRAMERER